MSQKNTATELTTQNATQKIHPAVKLLLLLLGMIFAHWLFFTIHTNYTPTTPAKELAMFFSLYGLFLLFLYLFSLHVYMVFVDFDASFDDVDNDIKLYQKVGYSQEFILKAAIEARWTMLLISALGFVIFVVRPYISLQAYLWISTLYLLSLCAFSVGYRFVQLRLGIKPLMLIVYEIMDERFYL